MSNAKRSFIRSVSVLVGGTAAGQAITALAMPALSRLYQPADFGTLAVFMGIVTTVSVAACLRYDIAIAVPESDEDGLALLALSLISATLISLLSALAIAVGFDYLAEWLDTEHLHAGKWLIPVGIFSAAAWSALQSWHIRKHNFPLMARARISQALAMVSTQSASALASFGPVGLVAGPPVGFVVSGAWFLKRAWEDLLHWLKRGQITDLRRVAREFRRFPAYSTWEALFNQAAIHLPIILIAARTTVAEAGYLMLAMYVLQAPLGLLGSAIGQVYLSRAPQAHREGNLAEFTNEVLRNLIKAGAGPILAIGVLSPIMFPLVFGAGWERAGWLVAWMTPWFLLQFLASPISMVLHVLGAQRTAMALQFFTLLLRLGITWIGTLLLEERISELYALSGAIAYGIYFIFIQAHLAAKFSGQGLSNFRSASLNTLIWLLSALCLALAISYSSD